MSQGGVQMLDQYVKDIQNWPRPTSCKEMSSLPDILEVLFPGTQL